MKRTTTVILMIMLAVCIFAGCSGGKSITGIWKCELYSSEQIIEFTADGRFIDHTSGDENRYKIKGDNIVVYVENVPESELAIAYEIKDDKLIFGEAEYVRTEFPEHMTAESKSKK